MGVRRIALDSVHRGAHAVSLISLHAGRVLVSGYDRESERPTPMVRVDLATGKQRHVLARGAAVSAGAVLSDGTIAILRNDRVLRLHPETLAQLAFHPVLMSIEESPIAIGEVGEGAVFLSALRDNGTWIVDLAADPPRAARVAFSGADLFLPGAPGRLLAFGAARGMTFDLERGPGANRFTIPAGRSPVRWRDRVFLIAPDDRISSWTTASFEHIATASLGELRPRRILGVDHMSRLVVDCAPALVRLSSDRLENLDTLLLEISGNACLVDGSVVWTVAGGEAFELAVLDG